MTNPIDALLAEKGVLLADGATGTNLFAMGLEAGEAPELLERDRAGEDRRAAPGISSTPAPTSSSPIPSAARATG